MLYRLQQETGKKSVGSEPQILIGTLKIKKSFKCFIIKVNTRVIIDV
jgi:hypothetical protein